MAAPKIAVVGISAELPSGQTSDKNLDHHTFFDFLLAGGESYEEFPSERLNINAWKGNYLGQIYPEKASFLKNVDAFDNVEFGVSVMDANAMSASTRKLIEHSFLALLDSGIDYRSRNVGCFASGINSYSELSEYEIQVAMASPPSMIANRVSYHLDLTGPSVPMDTACSSTCTALHLAFNAICNGDCEAAVVAGSQLNISFPEWFYYSQGSMLAKDGKCKPFDASADGFSRSEAVIAIVLKPLEDALRDGDHIYASVLGTGLTSTGSAAPPGAPVAKAQSLAMRQAFERAHRFPTEVDYVECHATGTAKGDPEETNWVIENFGREDKLWIGSVKGNIGHTEINAFLSSLTKVISVIKHQIIPPNANLNVKNPAIHWDATNIDVPIVATPLPCRPGMQPLIAIASTGIGGVNGHAVIEGPPSPPVLPTIDAMLAKLVLVTAGGLSPRSAALVADSMAQLALENLSNIHTFAMKAGRRTRQMTWRTFAVVDSTNQEQIQFPPPVLVPRERSPIVFVFSGQGPQYIDMGRELFQAFPTFRCSILECDQVYKSITNDSLVDDWGLFGDVRSDRLSGDWPVAITLPAIAAFQIAMFDLLEDLGIVPDIVIGHSAGETSSLYGSGAGSKAMTMELAIARGKALATLESLGGTMAALSCGPYEALKLIKACHVDEEFSHPVEIACFNSHHAVTIAGPEDKVQRVVQLAVASDISAKKLKTRVPVHSSMMENCRDLYQSSIEGIFERYSESHSPHIPTYSSVTGEIASSPFDSEGFWRNARFPVRFSQALEALLRTHPTAKFVEISPHPVLSAYIGEMATDPDGIFATARRPRIGGSPVEHRTFLEFLGQMLLSGYNAINFSRIPIPLSDTTKQIFPAYPFQRKSFPLYLSGPAYTKQIEPHNGPLNHNYLRINQDTHPFLMDHAIRGQPIMPGAGFLEMAFEFGAPTLIDVNFRRLFPLSSPKPVPVKVRLEGCAWSVKSSPMSVVKLVSHEIDTLHAEGLLSFDKVESPKPIDLSGIKRRCLLYTDKSSFYKALGHAANFGPIFQRVIEVYYGYDEAIARIRCKDSDLLDHDFRFHPAILDACFHLSAFPPFHGNTDANVFYLPEKVGLATLHGNWQFDSLPQEIFVYYKLIHWRPDAITYDLFICDMAGLVMCTLKNFEVKAHLVHPLTPITRRFDVQYPIVNLSPARAVAPSEVSNEATDSVSGITIIAPRINGNNAEGSTSLWNSEVDLLFHYEEGGEIRLQQYINGLDTSKPLTLWITVQDGRGADEVTGISRALRKEVPSWIIRVITFQSRWAIRLEIIRSLPLDLANETEFTVTSTGDIVVPRLALIEFPIREPHALESSSDLGASSHAENQPSCSILIDAYSASKPLSGFVGHYLNPSLLPNGGRHVIGVTDLPSASKIIADEASLVPYDGLLDAKFTACIPGLLVAAIAPSLSVYRNKDRLQRMRVLLTHSNTVISRVVSRVYRAQNVALTEIGQQSGLIDLIGSEAGSFDLIISGHGSSESHRIAQVLLRPAGKSFFWNFGSTSLSTILQNDPCLVGEALAFSLQRAEELSIRFADIDADLPLTNGHIPKAVPPPTLFSANRSYLLIGGAGSLGPHIALWMYRLGARSVVLTSRSGESSLHRKDNEGALRVLRYLQSIADFNIVIEKFDASDAFEMRRVVKSLEPALGGCFILTADNSDRLFANMTKQDFTRSHQASYGVLHALQFCTEIEKLEFLVAFSSVSAVFGNPGQSNYGAAKLVVDGIIKNWKNAFSFICPPIVGTSMVSEVRRKRKGFLAKWDVSVQEMLQWLEDGLNLIKDGHDLKFYIPDFDWGAMDVALGMTSIGTHLLPAKDVSSPVASDVTSKKAKATEIVRNVLSIPAEDLSHEVPLTSYGLDSLSASRLSFTLQRDLSLEVHQIRLLANMTLGDIEAALQPQQQLETADASESLGLRQMMKEMLDGLARFSPAPIPRQQPLSTSGNDGDPDVSSGNVVLITGTTGALGSQILRQLVENSSVTLIYALNRRLPGQPALLEKQRQALRKQGLDEALANSPKIIFVEYKPAAPDMGLPHYLIQKLSSSVTHVMHNAWASDFASSLPVFDELLTATRSLLSFARDSTRRDPPAFIFISTIGVCHYSPHADKIPEEPITPQLLQSLKDMDGSYISGYLQSKWIAEEAVRQAGEAFGMRTAVIRVGLLSGGAGGTWDPAQWFPALVKSSLHLKCVPTGDDIITWLPMDTAAAAIVDLTTSAEASGTLHVVHPRPTTWASIVEKVATILRVPLVSYEEWYKRLEDSAHATTQLSAEHKPNPAVSLLGFFHPVLRRIPTESMGLMPRVEVDRGKAYAATLADVDLPQLGVKDVERWFSYWQHIGFLPSSF